MSLHTGAARGFAPCLTPAKGFPPFANPRAAPEKDMKHYEVISLDIAIFGLDASDHYRWPYFNGISAIECVKKF